MYTLKTSAAFDSAHFLAGYNGKCANIHGHRWTVKVTVAAENLIESGEKRSMVIDFGDLNNGLCYTYHDGDYVWSYWLHFNWKNQPDHLILEDDDHFEYDFTGTSLKTALSKKSSKKIYNY